MESLEHTVLFLQQRIDKLENRLVHSVKGGSISSDADTTGAVHTMQTTSLNGGEVHPSVQLMQHYGISSVPLPGCRHLSASSSGINDSKVIIATHDPRHHPTGMSAGETQMYDNQGQSIYLKNSGVILTSTGNFEFVVSGVVVATIDQAGNFVAKGTVTSNGINLTNHIHHGVQNGNGITAAPTNN